MFKTVLSCVRTTPFTTHYTILTDGAVGEMPLTCVTVHRCPCCGRVEMIRWVHGIPFVVKHGSFLPPSSSAFGFRKVGGVTHLQSYCKRCRK